MSKPHALGRPLLLIGTLCLAIIAIIVLIASEMSLQTSGARITADIRTVAYDKLETIARRLAEHVDDPAPPAESLEAAKSWLEPMLARLVADRETFLYAMLVTPEGVIAAHSDAQQIDESLPARIHDQLTPAADQARRMSQLDAWFGEHEILNYAVPVVVDGERVGALHVGAAAAVVDQRVADQRVLANRLLFITSLLCLVVVAAGAGSGWFLIRRARRQDAAAARLDHLAEVGRLAGGLAHEIRNPLNAMRMQIAVAKSKLRKVDGADAEAACSQLGKLEGEVLRLQDLVTNFLAYGRPPADELQEFEIAALVDDVADFVRPEFESAGMRVDAEIDEAVRGATVVMDRGKLRQVLLNLLENARHAMEAGGQVTVTLRLADAKSVELTIADTGRGIPPAKLPRVFDAFFSTKDDGNGLGLAIVKRIVESAGGKISVDSTEGQGTRFVLTLPVATRTQRREMQAKAAAKPQEALA